MLRQLGVSLGQQTFASTGKNLSVAVPEQVSSSRKLSLSALSQHIASGAGQQAPQSGYAVVGSLVSTCLEGQSSFQTGVEPQSRLHGGTSAGPIKYMSADVVSAIVFAQCMLLIASKGSITQAGVPVGIKCGVQCKMLPIELKYTG